MRVVLDACVPERLARYIAGHEVTTVRAALGTTSVVSLRTHSNAIEHLVPLVPTLLTTLSGMQPGELRVLGV